MHKFYFAFLALLLSVTASAQINFLEPKEVFSGYDGRPRDLAATVANLDGEGRPDLVVFRYDSDSGISWRNFQLFANDGANNFTDTLAKPDDFSGFHALYTFDFNGNGLDDLLSGRGGNYLSRSPVGDTYESIGLPIDADVFVHAHGDLDADGDQDLLLGRYATFDETELFIGINDGNGNMERYDTLNTYYKLGFGDISPSYIGDLNGDDRPDILCYHNSNLDVDYPNPFQLYYATESDTFLRGELAIPKRFGGDLEVGASNDTRLQVIDIDNDQDLDVTYSNPRGVFVVRNDGAGNFGPIDTLYLGDYDYELADLDMDGSYELLVGSESYWGGVSGEAEIGYIIYDATSPIPYRYEDRIALYEGGEANRGWTVAVDVDGDTDLDILSSQGIRTGFQNLIYLFENDLFTPIVNVDSPPQAIPALDIFPNPTLGSTELQLRLPEDVNGETVLRLHTAQGQVLQDFTIAASPTQASLTLPSGLPDGPYFYTLYAVDGSLVAAGKILHQ